MLLYRKRNHWKYIEKAFVYTYVYPIFSGCKSKCDISCTHYDQHPKINTYKFHMLIYNFFCFLCPFAFLFFFFFALSCIVFIVVIIISLHY